MLSRIRHELVVVSDVHLLGVEEYRGKLFLELLKSIDTSQVRHLVLLGDIFDFCVGSSPYFQKKFSSFGEELSRISNEGVRIYYVEGNHEFLMQHLPWQGVEFTHGKNLRIETASGHSFAFTHGDYLKAAWHYRLYAQLVRSELSRVCALRVPQKYLEKLALAISAKSRKQSYSKAIDHKDIVGRIGKWLKEQKAEFGIVGHFHVPYNVKMPHSHGRIFGLDSWDKPNCLTFSEGQFFRIYPKNGELKTVSLDIEN